MTAFKISWHLLGLLWGGLAGAQYEEIGRLRPHYGEQLRSRSW